MSLRIALTGFCTLVLISGCANRPPAGVNDTGNSLANVSNSESKGQTTLSKDQMICKVRTITGSRFKQKTCMTAEEWKNMAEGSKNMVTTANRIGFQGNPDGG